MSVFNTYTITSAGGTLNTYLDYSYSIKSSGTISLAASFSIVPITPVTNSPIYIRWEASVNLNTYAITIAGIGIPQDQVNQPGSFELVFDGSGYTLQYFPDFTSRPQETFGITTITVPSGGGTLTIVPGEDTRTYVLQGTTTLSSNYTVVGSTSGVTNGSAVRVVISGGITIGANTVTVFGQSISSYDCLIGGAEVYAEFNALTSTYVATYVNRNIPLAKILTTGLGSGDDGKLVTYDFATNEFVTSFLSALNLPTGFKGINVSSTTISSGQILAMNTTPVQILPGTGSASEAVVPLMFLIRGVYGTTTYSTNTDAYFTFSAPSITARYAEKTDMLGFTTSGIDILLPTNYSGGWERTLATANYPLFLHADVADPTGGNSSIVVTTISVTVTV
jgi:hypothetical protein